MCQGVRSRMLCAMKNGIAANPELIFRYESSDIPAGLTLAEWRRSRARLKRRTRRAILHPFTSRTR
jgi:hypothetical protein